MSLQAGELWVCPKCGNRFVSRNLWHSCGTFDLDELFANSQPPVRVLFDRVIELVQSCGPVTVIPQKSCIAIQSQVRFDGCVVRKSFLRCAFWFPYEDQNPGFVKIEHYGPKAFGHFTRIYRLGEKDEEFMGWIRTAYAVGQRQHLD